MGLGFCLFGVTLKVWIVGVSFVVLFGERFDGLFGVIVFCLFYYLLFRFDLVV